jgi:hypothetical protein
MTSKKQSLIKRILSMLSKDGFKKHRYSKYKISRISLVEQECSDNKTVILINDNIVAHIKENNDIEYEYDEKFIKTHNYDIKQIHNDFIKLLSDSEWLC